MHGRSVVPCRPSVGINKQAYNSIIYDLRYNQLHIMLVDNEYEHLFHQLGVEDKSCQEVVLEYIFNLARLGIECVNDKHKKLIIND